MRVVLSLPSVARGRLPGPSSPTAVCSPSTCAASCTAAWPLRDIPPPPRVWAHIYGSVQVVVFTGLLDLLGPDDDQLAAVMAHEVAHVLARHQVGRCWPAGPFA